MLGATFAMLLVGGALGHYGGGGYDQNRLERNEPAASALEPEVECPVCGGLVEGLLGGGERCSIVRDDRRYKRCRHGVYRNERCGNRLDCYRGPGEFCSEKLTNDLFGYRCAPASYCHKKDNVCTGLNYEVDTRLLKVVNPSPYVYLEDRRQPRNDTLLKLLEELEILREEERNIAQRRPKHVYDLDYAIRERRAA